jgi:hypothetical protein
LEKDETDILFDATHNERRTQKTMIIDLERKCNEIDDLLLKFLKENIDTREKLLLEQNFHEQKTIEAEEAQSNFFKI